MITSFRVGGVLCAVLALGTVGLAQEREPAPAFRAGVDVVEIDVQVLRRDGEPVPDLTADKFDVRIGGQRRRVAGVQFVRFDGSAVAGGVAVGRLGAEDKTLDQAMAGRRLFMIAIDALSFDSGESRGVAVAAQRFVEQLSEADLVGLFTYPSGPRVDPTTEHAEVLRALERVSGQRVNFSGRFSLQPSEIVDYMASPDERPPIIRRHCGASDPLCARQLDTEVVTLAGIYEAMVQTSVGMLRDMIDQLGKVPGRKVVVLTSAGLPVSDRPGGRPNVGDLPQQLGEASARANVLIYALFVDNSMLRGFAAEQRGARRQLTNVARESELLGRWLDEFSGSAGGTMIKVMVDSGEAAYRQIGRETSAHYLLAVEPDRSDRTGRARRIQVRVDYPNTTVRARQWIVLPQEAPGVQGR